MSDAIEYTVEWTIARTFDKKKKLKYICNLVISRN